MDRRCDVLPGGKLGSYISLLILLLFSLLFPRGAAQAGTPGCLRCHEVHVESSLRCVACHRGDERTDRKNIAHDKLIPGAYAHFRDPESLPVTRGRRIIEQYACRRCHTFEGKGGRLAARLDLVLAEASTQRISAAIRNPAFYMPDFHFSEAQITDLVNAILSGSVRGKRIGQEPPQVVHFESGKRTEENVFGKRCGPCHKVLTAKKGGIGKGTIGPNLSGLFSEDYPKTWRGKERWTPDRLKAWVENPRKVKPFARMPPVRLNQDELADLTDLLAP